MQATGKVIFKGIEYKEPGSFVNSQNKVVNYPASYKIKIDENVDGKIYERSMKIAESDMALVKRFQELKAYTPIVLECRVEMYASRVSLVPINFGIDSAK